MTTLTIGECFAQLARSLQENDTLHTLNIAQTGLVDGDNYEGMEQLCRALTVNDTLTSLNVVQTTTRKKGIRKKGGKLLMVALQRNISIFKLCNIPVQDLRRRSVHKQQELVLRNCDIGGGEAFILAEQIAEAGQSLGRLDLGCNQIGADCQDGLIQLADVMHLLTDLDLSHNALGKHDGQQGTVQLADVLKENTTITRLNLAHNDLSRGSMRGKSAKKGLVALARALLTNATLTHLDLSNNAQEDSSGIFGGQSGFGSQCMFAWNSALQENSTCSYISLADCGLIRPVYIGVG